MDMLSDTTCTLRFGRRLPPIREPRAISTHVHRLCRLFGQLTLLQSDCARSHHHCAVHKQDHQQFRGSVEDAFSGRRPDQPMSARPDNKAQSSVQGPKILTGNKFLLEGFSDEEEKQLRSVIVGQGASVARAVGSKVSCLIAKVVGGPIFRVCVENKIPIVSPQWLVSCVRLKRWVPLEEHAVPAFSGLIVTCTGFEAADRDEMKVAVERLGGVFMKDLVKGTTTHLICFTPSGAKFECARRWGSVKIVTAHWIIDCVESQHWLAEERYPVVEAAAEEVAVAETRSADDERDATRKRPPDAEAAEQATSRSQPSEVATKKPRTAESAEDDSAVRAATALHSAEQFLAESLSVDALPSFSESGAALAAQTRADEDDWRKLFAGKLFFVGGYPLQIRRYLQRMVLLAGGQLSVVLDQDVHFAALYLAATPSAPPAAQGAVLSSIQRVQASQHLVALHQRALRLSKASGLQRVNLVWCLDVLVGRSHWEQLLPAELRLDLPAALSRRPLSWPASTAAKRRPVAEAEEEEALDLLGD